MKKFLNLAFTMAEAILVMTILGIIATIMISTLKPAEFKEKGMQVMVKKVISEIDNATLLILLNDSTDGTMNNLRVDNEEFGYSTCSSSPQNCSEKLVKLYKKYIATLRQTPKLSKTKLLDGGTGYADSYSGANSFLLKDGASMAVVYYPYGYFDAFYPGDGYQMACSDVSGRSIGAIGFDINDNEPPNVLGKDRFILLIDKGGINWDGPTSCYCCSEEDIANGCPMPPCSLYN